MGLTVVTHTAGNRQTLLARSVESVERNLPLGAKHKIIQTNDFNSARVQSLELDDIIVFVDDDDVVTNNSIDICFNLITEADCGLVFTNQRYISLSGEVLAAPEYGNIMYDQIIDHPCVAHHLAMFQPKYISESPRLIQHFGMGVCWMLKAEAGLKGTAIHVPIFGYDWTQHAYSMSASLPITVATTEITAHIQNHMRDWLSDNNPIAIPIVYPTQNTKKLSKVA